MSLSLTVTIDGLRQKLNPSDRFSALKMTDAQMDPLPANSPI